MIFHDVEQNTDEWFHLRLGKATASNFAIIMANDGKEFGDPAKRYALQIALERITGRRSGTGFSNEHTERGHAQEPIARALYEAQDFVTVTNGGFFCCGDYGDSPDGLIDDCGVLEIKCVIAPVHYANIRRQSFDPAYRWQLLGHLDCTGREWVDFVSYCSDFPDHLQVFRDRVMASDHKTDIAKLQARRAQFLGLVLETMENLQEKMQ